MPAPFYARDLAYIHDAGFGDFARRVAPAIVRMLRSRGVRSGRVVEIGCGPGTLARVLSDAGYEVLGIDVSPAMIRMARLRAPRVTFRVAALATLRIPPCDAVVAIGDVVSYIPGATTSRAYEAGLVSFLGRARRALRPGGVLVFDFIESTRGRTYGRKRLMAADWALAVRAEAGRGGRTLVRRIETFRRTPRGIRRSVETHRLRVRGRGDMRRLLARLGLRVSFSRCIGRVKLLRSTSVAIAKKVGSDDDD
jgi:SAM-dependent methyltransferase